MRKEKRYKKATWFASKWFLLALLTVALLISVSLIKEIARSYRINKEISQLRAQVLGAQADNSNLQNFVEYLKTDRYFEEEARLKFGKKLAGEKEIVLKNEEQPTTNPEESSLTFSHLSANKKTTSNPRKWFVYLFGEDGGAN